MNDTLENYLQVVAPHLSHKLVSDQALSYIQTITKILPPLPEVLLECRLGDNNPNVDFSVLAKASDGSRDILAGLSSTNALPNAIFTNPVWSRIRDFCLHWHEPNSLLAKNIDNIWLEFDVEEQPQNIPIPSFFFHFKYHPKFIISKSHPFQEQKQTIATALSLLLEHSLTPEIKQNLAICCDSLPAESQLLYIGAMLSRPLNAVRVNIIGIPEEELENYLTKIGWTYPIKKLKELIKVISNFVDIIVLNFDVGNTILPKVGIECELLKKSPHLEPRWQLFLDYLVKIGLCTPEKRDAFLSWHGHSYEESNPELWSSNVSRVSSILFRRLNHLKIVYYPNSYPEAKGYLSFSHKWIHSCQK